MTELAHRPWNAWRITRWTVAGTLLAVPALAMQVSDEVNWTVGDFVFAGVMIIGTALLYEAAVKLSGGWAYRTGVAVALTAAFLLIWVNLAVGVIGNEDDPHNAAYFCEVLLAAAAAFAAAFRPAGMSRAMLATGGFQLLITALAAHGGWGASEPPGFAGVLVLNLGFAGMWLLSAGLFWQSVRRQAGSAP
uniref:hypothetical protein n=1 Tax=Altererythrobacter segetis TaxID=1104773 RepID=UPI00140916E2|nr:hypothetical protein [Altererythrobacter segetis]